jgi:multicomponent Na+:H+ antiporter subunit F
MNDLFLLIVIFITLLIAASLYRIVSGPTVFDRIIGSGLIGTNTVMILVLIGFLYGRIDMFVDLALAYAMLNFIGIVALAKYFERRQEEPL